MLTYLLLGLSLLVFIALAGLSMLSHRVGEIGLVAGSLRDCPDSPNCVCSEGTHHNIEAVQFSARNRAHRWNLHRDAIIFLGGKIEKETEHYLWATFRTPLLRFVDDVELRLDDDTKRIQLRSASRVGRSDFGVNLRRAKQIQQYVLEHETQ